MFLRCPRQWAYRYLEGRKVKPSGAMKQSGVFHSIAEANYRQKIVSGKDLSETEMTDSFATLFEHEWEREELLPFQEGESKAGFKDQGVDIVREHWLNIAPKVQPVTVEQKFELTLGKDDSSYSLSGRIDVVDFHGAIRDNKAMGRAPSQEEVDKDLQLTTYSLAHRVMLRHANPELDLADLQKLVEPELTFDAIIKTKRPEARIFRTRRSREGLRMHLNTIGNVAKAIRADAFPRNPTGWWCSERWCGYWHDCMGKGLVSVDLGEFLEPQLKESLGEAQGREEEGSEQKEGQQGQEGLNGKRPA
jgi:hypothetical protein